MKNVFVFGADSFNVAQLEALNTGNQYKFHELFTAQEVKQGPEFPVQRLLEHGLEKLERFPGSVEFQQKPASSTRAEHKALRACDTHRAALEGRF